ncbi:MAG: hypothetical protein ABIV07_03985 [Polaromonas sp.]
MDEQSKQVIRENPNNTVNNDVDKAVDEFLYFPHVVLNCAGALD